MRWPNRLMSMTDQVGLVEHATSTVPNLSEGYSVDDNARAIQVCSRLGEVYPNLEEIKPVVTEFVLKAERDDGFMNDFDQGEWVESNRLGEHFGRAAAALAETEYEKEVWWEYLTESTFPRVWAEGLGALKWSRSPHRKEFAERMAERLVALFRAQEAECWFWFEEEMIYDNGRLPMGLLWAYQMSGKAEYLEVALKSLDFLTSQCWNQEKECFSYPGTNGWFHKNGERSEYDQQPIEAGSMVEACALAYEVSRKETYAKKAMRAYGWYWGKNIESRMMVDETSGGVFDGLMEGSVNPNQGAESTLSLALAESALRQVGLIQSG